MSQAGPELQTGLASEDMENIEDQTEQDDKKRHMKSMGLPEIDPDALPSSVVGKYLTAMAKRMTKMQQILDKFSGLAEECSCGFC
eukprot:s934_g20.t1